MCNYSLGKHRTKFLSKDQGRSLRDVDTCVISWRRIRREIAKSFHFRDNKLQNKAGELAQWVKALAYCYVWQLDPWDLQGRARTDSKSSFDLHRLQHTCPPTTHIKTICIVKEKEIHCWNLESRSLGKEFTYNHKALVYFCFCSPLPPFPIVCY